MDIKRFNLKNKILSLIILALVLMLNGLALFGIGTSKLLANSIIEFTDLNNGDFTSTSSSKKPATPNNWNLTDDLPENVKAGVISLNETVFEENKEDYNLDSAPTKYSNITTSDSNILMLNARTGVANIGYKSNTFTFEKGSYYSISVWAYSQTQNNAYGSIALTGNDALTSKVNSVKVATLGTWQEYQFYVKTNSINSLENLTLELWLGDSNGSQSTGATGAIFYDNIQINQLTAETYQRLYQASQDAKSNVIEIDLQSQTEDIINNADFESTTLSGWTAVSNNNSNIDDSNNINGVYAIDDINDKYAKEVLKVNEAPTNGNTYNNKKALLINNSASKESIGYESDAFTLEENSIYKLSVWSKSNIEEGTAQIVLAEQPYKQEDKNYDKFNENLKSFSLNLSSSTNDLTNDWIEYSMFITTRSYTPISNNDYNFSLKLQLWVGTESSPAKGYAFFDNITLTKINSAELAKATSNSTNNTKANFMDLTDGEIVDGGFNQIEIADVSTSYPYAPSKWTLTSTNTDTYNQLNGIINTNSTKFSAFKAQLEADINSSKKSPLANSVINPILNSSYPDNNILMIGNLTDNYQQYESQSISLKADSYYSLSVDVLTYNLNKATAGIRLISDDIVASEILKITTNGNWENYKLLIKTGSTDTTATLQLSLGINQEGSGYAYFDNAVLSTLTEEQYNDGEVTCKEFRKVNLANDDFTNTSYSVNQSTGLYDANGWTFSTIETDYSELNYGIVDTSKTAGYTTPDDASSKNIMMLNIVNSNSYLSYSSKKLYEISQDSYYEISIYVKTNNISHYSEEDGEYGASFLVTGDNKTFNGFKGIDTNGEWKKYSIFVNSSDKTDYTLILALGNSTDFVSGEVQFSTLLVNKIEETAYTEGVKVLEDKNAPDNVMAIGNTDIVTEDDGDDETDDNGFVFDFNLISGLITALAILIALIGFGIRKIHYKKPVKIGKGDYDRTLLLKKVQEHEQKMASHNNKLEELRQQLEQIKQEIIDAKASYKAEVNSIEDSFKQEITTLEQETATDVERQNEIAMLKQQAKDNRQAVKLEKKHAYNEKRKALLEKYNLIEKEIELLYQEELELIKEYKLYKKQVKAKRLEIKEARKNKN